jgi:hypothetical protein
MRPRERVPRVRAQVVAGEVCALVANVGGF